MSGDALLISGAILFSEMVNITLNVWVLRRSGALEDQKSVGHRLNDLINSLNASAPSVTKALSALSERLSHLESMTGNKKKEENLDAPN